MWLAEVMSRFSFHVAIANTLRLPVVCIILHPSGVMVDCLKILLMGTCPAGWLPSCCYSHAQTADSTRPCLGGFAKHDKSSHASCKVLDFFPEISRTWKVLENEFGPGKSLNLRVVHLNHLSLKYFCYVLKLNSFFAICDERFATDCTGTQYVQSKNCCLSVI